jgi:tetratricopeptide (TPR) repeat protein
MSCDAELRRAPSRRVRASSVAVRCALAFSLIPFAALAERNGDSKAESGAAKADFANAIKLYKEDNAADALPVFQRVAETTRSPNAYLYVGHCLVKLRRYVEAHEAFSATLKAIRAQPDEKYEATREAALSQLASISQRVAKLVVSVTDTPPGLAVEVDGKALAAELLGSALVLEAGDHHVAARADDREAVEREIHLDLGEEKTVALALQKPNGEPLVRTVLVPAPPRQSSAATFKTIGFVASGVGVLGVGVFAVTGLQTKSIHDELKSSCPAGCSDAAHQSDIERGKSLQTVANAGLVLGAVGVLSGGVLLYLGYSKSAESSPSVAVSPRGVTLGYRARF